MSSKLKRRNILIALLVVLFLLPIISVALDPEELADDRELIQLEKGDAVSILGNINQKSSDQWVGLPSPEEQVILMHLKKSVENERLQYFFVDLAGDWVKSALELSYFLLSGDPKVALDQIEDYTVDQAKEYALDWFLQKEIKIGRGNFDYGWPALDGSGYVVGNIPYIIIYNPISINSGEVIIGVYSSEIIKTPIPTVKFPWEGGVNELPPYKVLITGEVEKTRFNQYTWTKGPEIEIIFDEPVPHFEFKELTFGEKVKSTLEKIKEYSGKFGQKVDEFFNLIGQGVEGIKSFFSGAGLLEASISSTSQSGLSGFLNDDREKRTDEEGQNYERGNDQNNNNNEKENGLEASPLANEIESPASDNSGNDNDSQSLEQEDDRDRESDEEDDHNDLEDEQSEKDSGESEDFEDNQDRESNEDEQSEEEQEEVGDSNNGASQNQRSPIQYCSVDKVGHPSQESVIFSEIAWMGTEESSSDEWIELYNRTGNDIDLSFWQIVDLANQIQISFDQGSVLPAHGFYLLERTNDQTVSDIEADLIYTGSLSNSDEAVHLFDPDCKLKDLAEADPAWPAGDNSEKRSMERGEDLNWHTFSGNKIHNVYGTPKSNNSAPAVSAEQAQQEESGEDNDDLKETSGSEGVAGSVIFNEIAWMGTIASAADEWIELYNVSEEEVSLSGWEILYTPVDGEARSILFEEDVNIGSSDYFLLERSDDETVSDVPADHIYTGALNNDGGILELFDGVGNLIDKVEFLDGWSGGDNDNKLSMERDADDSWITNNTFIRNGEDKDGNKIYGTPGQENSVGQKTIVTYLYFNDFDQINIGKQTGQYVMKGILKIPVGKTLDIAAGVSLRFASFNSLLKVQGTLKALGTDVEKIRFDSASPSPAPGSWGGIYFESSSIDSEMSNIVLKNAGGMQSFGPAGVQIDGTLVSISDSLFEDNESAGIEVIDADPLFHNITFLNNPESGLFIRGGSPTISNSVFSGNKYGARIEKGIGPTFSDNIFENNETPIFLKDSSLIAIGTTAQDNDLDAVLTFGSIETENVLWNFDLPIVVKNPLAVFSDLTILPGSIIKFQSSTSGIDVYNGGVLTAPGESDNQILFTAISDSPEVGDWGDITFKSGSQGTLSNIIIEYGGSSPLHQGVVRSDDSSLSITDSIIRFNQGAGVFVDSGIVKISNTRFIDNQYGVFFYNQSSVEISNSDFKKHQTAIHIGDQDSELDLVNVSFGVGSDANNCNIYQLVCLDPAPED